MLLHHLDATHVALHCLEDNDLWLLLIYLVIAFRALILMHSRGAPKDYFPKLSELWKLPWTKPLKFRNSLKRVTFIFQHQCFENDPSAEPKDLHFLIVWPCDLWHFLCIHHSTSNIGELLPVLDQLCIMKYLKEYFFL